MAIGVAINNIAIGVAIRAMLGEDACGDFWGAWEQDGQTTLCMIDGLGHGELAEEAAQGAYKYIEAHQDQSVIEILQGCGRSISHTRGAAVGVGRIDHAKSELTYAGIGNTRTMVVGRTKRRLPSLSGIVGVTDKLPIAETVALASDDLLIMSTDGFSEALTLDQYGSSTCRDVQLLADRLMEDWSTQKDDACVLLYRYGDPLQ